MHPLYTGLGRPPLEFEEGLAVMVQGGSARIGSPARGTVTGFSRMPVRVAVPEDGCILFFPVSFESDRRLLNPGTPVTIRIETSPKVEEAIGGGPRILRSGRVSMEFSAEGFGPAETAYLKKGRHPRSAVGYNADRDQVFLVMVEGRSRKSQGMDMAEFADIMLFLGIRDAMAFDGGGSAGLYVGDHMASPALLREISDALGVFARKAPKP